MRMTKRTDGLGWDMHIELEHGHTLRSIITLYAGFAVINPFKLETKLHQFTTFADAAHAAENLLV